MQWILRKSDHPNLSLWSVLEAPEQIYIHGKEESLGLLEALPNKGFGVVGTRYPLEKTRRMVRHWIAGLKERDLVVVSGFARGIDQEAHRAAVESGIKTVAILGTGLDVEYPNGSSELRNEILQTGGLLLSEFPLGTPALPRNFLRRNRLIAGLSRAVLVAEASIRSGSLNTAQWAYLMEKACFAVPSFPGDPSFEGNEWLLSENRAKAFWDLHSLSEVWLDLFADSSRKELPKRSEILKQLPKSTPLERLLYRIQSHTDQLGSAHLDTLSDWAMDSGTSSQELSRLLDLLLKKEKIRFTGDAFVATNQ